MSKNLIARQNQKKFIKLLSLCARTASHPSKGTKKTINMPKSSVSNSKLKQFSLFSKFPNEINNPHRTINTVIDSLQVRYNHNDGRSKIEALLLEQCHKLFSSTLSPSATERLLKKHAEKIASSLSIDKKQFRASKKWLKTFIKKCKQLGYLNDSGSLSEKVDQDNFNCHTTWNGKDLKLLNDANSSLLNSSSHPDLLNLFATKNQEQTNVNVEQKTSSHPDLLDLFAPNNQKTNVDPEQNDSKTSIRWSSKSKKQSIKQSSSSPPKSLKKFPGFHKLSNKNTSRLKPSCIIPTQAFNKNSIGFRLSRNIHDNPDKETGQEFEADVYNQLFLFSNPDLDATRKTKIPGYSIDSVDSGYRSRSVSKSDDQSETADKIAITRTTSFVPISKFPKHKLPTFDNGQSSSRKLVQNASPVPPPHSSNANLPLFADPLMRLFESGEQKSTFDTQPIDSASTCRHRDTGVSTDTLIHMLDSKSELSDTIPQSFDLSKTCQNSDTNTSISADPLTSLFSSSYKPSVTAVECSHPSDFSTSPGPDSNASTVSLSLNSPLSSAALHPDVSSTRLVSDVPTSESIDPLITLFDSNVEKSIADSISSRSSCVSETNVPLLADQLITSSAFKRKSPGADCILSSSYAPSSFHQNISSYEATDRFICDISWNDENTFSAVANGATEGDGCWLDELLH